MGQKLFPFSHLVELQKGNPHSLTHCILVDSSVVICWMSPSVILGVLDLFCPFYSIFDFRWKILLANNTDPDQMPHYVASELANDSLTDFQVRMG